MTTTAALPRWDMSVIFPSLESPEFEQQSREVVAGIADLGTLFERLHIGEAAGVPAGPAPVEALDTVLTRFNNLLEQVYMVGAYINSFVATNSRDTVAQAKLSEFQQEMVRLSQLGTRLTAWIGTLE